MKEIYTQLKARFNYIKSNKKEIRPVGFRLAHKPTHRDINSFFSSLAPNGEI